MGLRKNYKDIIAWWSGGVTSAVTCMICIETYGRSRVRVIFIDTHNEHEDTYRFKKDCEDWYKLPIETISNIGEEYKTIQDVWTKHKSLNVAHGAICSYKLKRQQCTQCERNINADINTGKQNKKLDTQYC